MSTDSQFEATFEAKKRQHQLHCRTLHMRDRTTRYLFALTSSDDVPVRLQSISSVGQHGTYDNPTWVVILSKVDCTDIQEKAKARLRELAPRGQREPGGGIHAT